MRRDVNRRLANLEGSLTLHPVNGAAIALATTANPEAADLCLDAMIELQKPAGERDEAVIEAANRFIADAIAAA